MPPLGADDEHREGVLGWLHSVARAHVEVAELSTAIDQGDRQPALGEMQGDRGADDAGAEHEGVDACHENLRGHLPSTAHAGRIGEPPTYKDCASVPIPKFARVRGTF